MEANNYCRHSRESGNLGLKQFFEFRLKAWIPAFAGMTLLLLPGLVHSEATKEYTRDAGIYSANPFSIFTFSFSSINVDFDSTSDPNPPEGLKVASTTVATQWGGWGIFNTTAMGNNVVTDLNFSDYVNGHLRFWLKSQIALDVKIEYQQGSNAVQVSSSVASTGNAWKEIVIPLQSGGFGLNNGQMNRIRSPFIVVAPQTTGVQKQWFIDHVRWTKPVTSIVMYPPSTTVQQGFHRLFTAEGRDAANERVIIYPTFSVSPTVGTFTPADPTPVTASRLNATGASGVANAVFSPLSASSVVTITGSHINDELGLLSETIPSSLILNTDSELDVSSGGGGTDPVLLDESSSDVREGVRRFKTTISAQPANGFSGWFIQWSTNAANTVTRDMSNYYDGSLRFWFKGPAALQNVLQISVRSGNTEAGTELSKVNLKNYVTFDDTWRPVVIPISDFTGARPKADLSRMKILFGAFAVGAVGSVQTFYIDNLRWDTNIPGALASLTVSPASVTVPLSAKRQFVAKGFDANGVSVDIFPTWTITGGIGSVNPSQGAITQLTAASSAQSGTLKASQGAVSATASVNVADVQWVQSFNVYSDNGSGGFVGVAKGTNNGTVMNLSEQNLGAGVAPEGKFVRQSNYTLVNNPNLQDAFAIWFTNADAGTGSRFMHYFDTGYLYFWVRTTQDLQISIRSANITAGNERSKFRLSELGVPLDNNWQKVVIALADFKNREPLLDFDQIQTYFAIGAVSSQIGPVTNQTFDVDDVKWLTNNPGQPDDNKIYIGLKEKQAAGGLVRSFDTLLDAYTYDQALAAMNYTYRKDVALSKKVFDVYKYVHDNYGGTFSGFHEDYNINSAVGGYTVLNSSRVAGPNAWILLAMIHYRNVTGSTAYDTVINDVAAWLRGLQGADGAVQFGRVNSTLITLKSTEHNFDVVAAFRAYAKMSGNSAYNSYADAARNWLQTQMYVPAQQRFNVGTYANGTTNTDRALDAYSWAPLALSSFTNVLTTAETDFKNTKVCDLTGLSVTGFDFSGPPNFGPDLDAVWLEGTGQMALAYYLTDNLAKGDFYLQELDKAIVNTSANGQGMAYATNNGTAYGFNMNSLNPAISSMAWYLFAKQKFNPFKPYPIYELKIMDTASGTERSSVGFTVSVPAAWVRADQYIKLDVQPNSVDPWGLQILTDNTQPTVVPRFVDPTPGTTSNSDSNPAGLLLELTGQTTTPYQINMAWSVKDTSATATMPIATDPNSGAPNSFQWIFMKDRATPDIPSMNTVAFANGQDDVIVRKAVSGSHTSQGPAGYTASVSPDYLFLEANFNSAAAQVRYLAHITFEFFLQ